MKINKKQPGETVAGTPIGFTTGNTVVDAVSQMQFEGNITDHRWFVSPRLKAKSGLINAIAIHVLADIVFWHRSIIERDPSTNVVIRVRKRFDGPELWFDYEYWAPSLGLTSRQLRDAVAFLHTAGIITRRSGFVRLRNGAKTNNVPIITINVEILHEITYGTASPRRPKRETPSVKTGDTSRQNGTRPTPERATSTHNSSENSLRASTSAPPAAIDDDVSQILENVIAAGVTPARARKLVPLHAAEFRRRLEFLPFAGNIPNPGAYICSNIETPWNEPPALAKQRQTEMIEAHQAARQRADAERSKRQAAELEALRALDDQLDAHYKSLDALDRADVDKRAQEYIERVMNEKRETPQALAIARRQVLKKEWGLPTEDDHEDTP